jgi:hypothetical protein
MFLPPLLERKESSYSLLVNLISACSTRSNQSGRRSTSFNVFKYLAHDLEIKNIEAMIRDLSSPGVDYTDPDVVPDYGP